MKNLIAILVFVFSMSLTAQTNQDLLSHYKKYYKQMQSQADIQGVINALTHLNILEPSQARKDTLATLYMNEGRHVEALNTIGIDKNDSPILIEYNTLYQSIDMQMFMGPFLGDFRDEILYLGRINS